MKRMFCVLLSGTMSIQLRCMMQVLFSAFLPHFVIVTTRMHVVRLVKCAYSCRVVSFVATFLWLACSDQYQVCLLFCLSAQPPAEFLDGVQVEFLRMTHGHACDGLWIWLENSKFCR